MIIGSAAVDVTSVARNADVALGKHSTSPGSVTTSLGGVGRNIAEASHRILSSYSQSLCQSTLLVSPVGNDAFGRLLTEETSILGMRLDGLVSTSTHRTAVCNMVLDSAGNLIGGVADMDIAESLSEEEVSSLIMIPLLAIYPVPSFDVPRFVERWMRSNQQLSQLTAICRSPV